jgi:hypothetical protein
MLRPVAHLIPAQSSLQGLSLERPKFVPLRKLLLYRRLAALGEMPLTAVQYFAMLMWNFDQAPSSETADDALELFRGDPDVTESRRMTRPVQRAEESGVRRGV